MAADRPPAEGFDAGDREVPTPPIEVADETRERLMLTLSAAIAGATPEEITEYIEDERFPAEVYEALGRPGERDELSAHVDLWLTVMQSPAPAAA